MPDAPSPRSLPPLTSPRTRPLLDALEEGVAILGSDGVVEYVNASGERILGVASGDLLGRKLLDFRWEIVDLEGRPLPREDLPPLRVLTSGAPSGPVVVGMTSPARRERVWVEVSARPLHALGEKERPATATSFRDVSDRVRAEQALRASEERYHTLAGSVPVGIFHTDPDDGVTWVNRAWTEVAGLSFEESLGDGWTRALHPDDREGVFEAWREAKSSGKPYIREHRFVRPSGEVRWVVCRAVGQTDDQGRTRGRIGSVTDITDAKSAESLKDQIIGLVSHELRTPLVALRGSLTFLERYIRDAEGERLYRMAVRNAGLLERLVRDLLDIERLEAGLGLARQETLVVSSVLTHACEVVHVQAAERGVTLREAESSPAVVIADHDRLLQLFTNLLANAVKFSAPGGEVRVDIVASPGSVTVGIHDSGEGIAPADHERIFEPFAQVGRSGARAAAGAGLGLAIARAIVQRHGGRIWVESELGRGASFYVSLPAS